MMGRLNRDQGQLFYSFCLDEVVSDDHRVREIAAALAHHLSSLDLRADLRRSGSMVLRHEAILVTSFHRTRTSLP